MREKDRKRVSMSFCEDEVDTLDIILRGLLRGHDLKTFAVRREPTLQRVARKTSAMSRRIAERKPAS